MNAATLKAMAHPLRLRILARAAAGEVTPVALAKVMGATLGTTSYHVRVLHDAGYLKLTRETQVRGAVRHHYRVAAKARRQGVLEALEALEMAAHEAREKLAPVPR